jgi:hypothetical protein
MRRGYLVVVLLSVAFLLSGCPKHSTGVPRGEVATAEQYLALQRARNVPESMRIRGNARILWPQRSVRVRTSIRMLLSIPAALRSDVLVAGRPQLQFSITDHGVDAYIRFAKFFAHADDPHMPFEGLSQGLLSRDSFLNALAGRLPEFEGWSGEAVREPGGLVRLDLSDSSGASASMWIYESTFEPQRVVGYLPGVEGVAYVIGFDDFVQLDAYRIPHLVTLNVPKIELQVELQYSEVDVSVETGPVDFELVAPEGVQEGTFEELLLHAFGSNGGGATAPAP